MKHVAAVFGLALVGLVGCGGGGGEDVDARQPDAIPPDADLRDLLVRLNDLPGVTAVEDLPLEPGTRAFDLMIEQPVDHFTPGGPTFQQNVTLVHRDLEAPMVALTTGYWNYQGYYPDELTEILSANQIAIEHRYFDRSRPVPTDWAYLTIEQSAADQHHITELLQRIYGARWLTTGASKGGMTASYHRRFWPDDVYATVPYVAPLSRTRGDSRYAAFLDTIGPPACRQALRDLEVELLQDDRFEAMLARATAEAEAEGLSYTRVAIGPATEGAITGIEWAFWQYVGVASCGAVPPVTASDDTMWDFLQQVSAVSGSTDPQLALFEAYYYQASYELGYPDGGGAFLTDLLRYDGNDYAGYQPVGVPAPAYRVEAMADIEAWVQSEGNRLMFIYGEWDPWTAGAYELGSATESMRYTAPQMTHGAGVGTLLAADAGTATATLRMWAGLVPGKPDAGGERWVPTIARPQVPRLPPAMLRGMTLRGRELRAAATVR